MEDKCLSESKYGSDSGIGNAIILKPERYADATVDKLAGHSS